ncbi:MAG: hypothetical protein J6T08_02785 [Lentisphaeria bacterium]|nr:hypothetical protein [Lentisphaeria bacterium]
MSNKLCIQIGMAMLVASLLLFAGYFLRKTPDKIMDASVADSATENVSTQKSVVKTAVNANAILSGNVFHPGRGKVGAKDNGAENNAPAVLQKAGQFELTGVFQYQNTRGALIAVQQLHADPKKQKPRRMYKLGDSLGNGYNLVEISDSQVVIARGSERITLPLRKKQDNKK